MLKVFTKSHVLGFSALAMLATAGAVADVGCHGWLAIATVLCAVATFVVAVASVPGA